MKITHTNKEIQADLANERNASKSVGFVPTMGALHQGHIELVKRCVAENNVCVVSIFVNPNQFNDKNDLLKYPRTLDEDCKLLTEAGCHYVFAPSVEEIYPQPDNREFDFGDLGNVMEGRFRPGHFNGVAQVVSRLFDIVKPNKAYFGLKDFQQLAIVRDMVRQLNLSVEIVPVPIVRESDGLAMSSRNVRLSENQRKAAVEISQTLFKSQRKRNKMSVEDLKSWVVDTINKNPELEVEYFNIVDGNTLKSIDNWKETDYAIGCIAVFAGEVRLIDNVGY